MLPDLNTLIRELQRHDVRQLLCKRLAENDNSKQQIYLGTGFETLNVLPFGEVVASSTTALPTMKAKLPFAWLDESGEIARAPFAQLILYPSYPEVRLSGFLRDCSRPPSELMRPVPSSQRRFNNGPDGRLLFLGITGNREVIAHVVTKKSAVAMDFEARVKSQAFHAIGVFLNVPLPDVGDSRELLLRELTTIHRAGWHQSCRLSANGIRQPYVAQNGAGYTLEALLNIIPNGRAEPDFHGWELKACGSDRLTLMTPEPNLGYYGEEGVAAFVRKYGRPREDDTIYFTGVHVVGSISSGTKLTLAIHGFDSQNLKVTDVQGGIYLSESNGFVAAGWSFTRLLELWGRKHALAAYVPYEKRTTDATEYRYQSPVNLGTGTTFIHFLSGMATGTVFYDPAPKIVAASSARPKVKARSQFRIKVSSLHRLYKSFTKEMLDH